MCVFNTLVVRFAVDGGRALFSEGLLSMETGSFYYVLRYNSRLSSFPFPTTFKLSLDSITRVSHPIT